ECILSHITLKECNARYLNLCMSKITQARFTACDLQSSDLSSCKFSSIAFEKCNLRESEFSHTPLRSIDLSQSDIEGIRANLSDLRGAIVNTRQALDLTALMGLKITNTDWNSGE
ncbi:MAG: pentapeptide repeat-containing protein, partial [Bacteroides sp.]|nr:pentapeptide repeat-containing protein [Bacteroides sp.]